MRMSLQALERVTAFMGSLTDERTRHLSSTIPAQVPSGLPVAR